jgi:hypothetical protein
MEAAKAAAIIDLPSAAYVWLILIKTLSVAVFIASSMVEMFAWHHH